MKDNMIKGIRIQLWIAIVLVLSGLVLLFMGFWNPPSGVIDNSVLIAFGEVSTFAGSLLGIDYKYRAEIFYKNKKNDDDKEGEV